MSAKTSADLLLDEINRLNNNAFKPGSISFGTPEAVEREDANTQVQVMGNPDEGVAGEQTIWYSRTDLTDLFTQAGVEEITLKAPGYTSTLQLLPELNATYELALDNRDITDDPLPPLNDEEALVILTAHPESLVFIGELMVTLQPGLIDLSSIIVHPVLDGLSLKVK